MTDADFLDGNALAGPLAEVFGVDVTAASGTCASCALEGAVAALRVWARGPGLVGRCPGCGAVMVRVVRSPGRVHVDLRGTGCLSISVPV